jgi:hypothetical protein
MDLSHKGNYGSKEENEDKKAGTLKSWAALKITFNL